MVAATSRSSGTALARFARFAGESDVPAALIPFDQHQQALLLMFDDEQHIPTSPTVFSIRRVSCMPTVPARSAVSAIGKPRCIAPLGTPTPWLPVPTVSAIAASSAARIDEHVAVFADPFID